MIRDGRTPEAIEEAARVLHAGGLVAFPTETVYGLGADAASDAAVAGIFAAKGRPSDHPLIVHVAAGAKGAEALSRFAQALPLFAQKLVRAFWPGPLTLIVARQPGMAGAAAGGQDTIGLRCPSHPVAQALLSACADHGVHGVAGPSANRFGRVSPTTARHVHDEFGDGLLVIDGGPCEVGIESTIVDCSRGVPVLLRPGAITRAQIEAACGEALRDKEALAAPDPRASGTLEAHYAPSAKVRLERAGGARIGRSERFLVAQRFAAGGLDLRARDGAGAQQLFAVLRAFDAEGVRLIWVETLPDTPEWEGVRDRLQRAAAA